MSNATITLKKNGATYTYIAMGDTVQVVTDNGLAYAVPMVEAKRAIQDRMRRGWVEA